jgi:glutaconate CoA-transferase subunit A
MAKTIKTKIIDLKTAVTSYVKDGSLICLGSAIAREPIAVAREIVRQKITDLTLMTSAQTTAGEILVGAGCLKKIEFAYFWIGVITQGRNFRRAIEKGIPRKPMIEEYSMYSAVLRVLAGSMGISFLPCKSLIGSDIPKYNPRIKLMEDPYTGEQIAIVPAVNPDVAFIHVQRCDTSGNAVIIGNLWNDITLSRAAKKTVITCEEIVSEAEIRSNPNMTAIPNYCVDAVVHVPFGAHPEPVDGYYWMDQPFRADFGNRTKTHRGFIEWLEEWVYKCPNHEDYLGKLGNRRLEKLKAIEKKFRKEMKD